MYVSHWIHSSEAVVWWKKKPQIKISHTQTHSRCKHFFKYRANKSRKQRERMMLQQTAIRQNKKHQPPTAKVLAMALLKKEKKVKSDMHSSRKSGGTNRTANKQTKKKAKKKNRIESIVWESDEWKTCLFRLRARCVTAQIICHCCHCVCACFSCRCFTICFFFLL